MICPRCNRTFRPGTTSCPAHGVALVPAEIVAGPDGLRARPLQQDLARRMRDRTRPAGPWPRSVELDATLPPPHLMPSTVVERDDEGDEDDETIEQRVRLGQHDAGEPTDEQTIEQRVRPEDDETIRQQPGDEIEALLEPALPPDDDQ